MTGCLVFGQSGQVAQSIAKLTGPYKALGIVQLGRGHVDLTEPGKVAREIIQRKPDIVINAAAYTKVDQAESDETTAKLVNASAPALMAEACKTIGAPLIHISTDYVFAGDGTKPYMEDDPVAPQGAYGRTKELGERAIRQALDRHIILRTAWVFSDTGQNFVRTMLKLNRDLIRVVDDQRGNPTPADFIAAACLQIAARIKSGQEGPWGTYHYTGQPDTTWFGFAQAIFAEAEKLGKTAPKLEPITTDQYPTPAKRPAWSVLDTAKILRDWGIEAPDWRLVLPSIVKSLMEQEQRP
jgi:dTDP-4-dehydrorhamnose reductase